MCSCAVPVLLVPKKTITGVRTLIVEPFNNIIVKYRYHIPRLDNMLNKLYGSSMFFKIDLKNSYHQIRMKE